MRRFRKILLNCVLVCVAVALSLGVMEVAARVLEAAGFWTAEDTTGVRAEQETSVYERVARSRVFENYVKDVPGLERDWFFEDPPYPAAKPRDPVLEDLAAKHRAKGLYGPNAWKLYNVGFFTDYFCNDRRGWTFPDPVFMYGPYDGSPYPFYRFPPNVTAPSGLIANRYGWKGEDIAPDKPPRTIRIAFLGASTTISGHGGHSYSDHIGYWLNRWAAAQGLDVRFEVINTGHETYKSMDTAAVVEMELLPLEPDIAVYYEGANQFRVKREIVGVPWAYLSGPVGKTLQDAGAYDKSALLRLVRRIAQLLPADVRPGDGLTELEKPSYTLLWPNGLDRDDPDITRDDLPLQLPQILEDLDRIRRAMHDSGGELVLSSFIWMVFDGMVVDPVNGRFFFDYTNQQLWPLTYKDARMLADFQNTVFRKYAEKNGIPFTDVAARFPRELSLFSDTIHMTPPGLRLRAWLMMQDILPLVRAKIESGDLPRADRAPNRRIPAQTQTVKRFDLKQLKCVADADGPGGYRVKVEPEEQWLSDEMAR